MSELKYEKKVTIRDVVRFFKFEQLTGNDSALDRWTVVPDINRPGFELCGFNKITEPRRIVVLGAKEIDFIGTMSEQEQRVRLFFLLRKSFSEKRQDLVIQQIFQLFFIF